MSSLTHDPPHPIVTPPEFVPDLYDPTAGAVAVSRELASEQVRIIADPAPLGLGAFALTTFMLSLVNAGVLPKDTEPVILGVALAYGGVAQILAGMWEFRKGNVSAPPFSPRSARSGCRSGPTSPSSPKGSLQSTTASRRAGTCWHGPSSPP